jgi:hypothetical protein
MPHWVDSSDKAGTASEKLNHLCSTMSHDAIIEGWSVQKIGVSSDNFIKATDIGSWEAAFKMFAQREMGI